VTRQVPSKAIWRVKAPMRVVAFMWTVVLGKIITIDNLIKRGMVMANQCSMCKRSGEVLGHLLTTVFLLGSYWSLCLLCSNFGG
jgi:hypothetical protein